MTDVYRGLLTDKFSLFIIKIVICDKPITDVVIQEKISSYS